MNDGIFAPRMISWDGNVGACSDCDREFADRDKALTHACTLGDKISLMLAAHATRREDRRENRRALKPL